MKKIILFLVIGALCGVASVFVPRILNENKKSVIQKATVYIPLNSSYGQMLDSIATAVGHMASFQKVAERETLHSCFKPGRYVFTPDKSNKDIVRMLCKGWETPMMLTLSGNIRGLEKLSGILGKKLAADSSSFMEYFLFK